MFGNNIIKASESEVAYYESVLYPLQDEIFRLIKTDRLYLSGGTCLSRFHYENYKNVGERKEIQGNISFSL